MPELDEFFLDKAEPQKGCLLFLRDQILALNSAVKETKKYGMPFYEYKNKRFCYLWLQRSSGKPYVGFTDGNKLNFPELIQEKRTRMKIMLIDPMEDIPIKRLTQILKMSISFCTNKN